MTCMDAKTTYASISQSHQSLRKGDPIFSNLLWSLRLRHCKPLSLALASSLLSQHRCKLRVVGLVDLPS